MNTAAIATLRGRRFVTSGDEAAARVADVRQAAFYRAELDAERGHLLTGIGKRQALIGHPGDADRRTAAAAHRAAEVRYLDGIIARLDSRFEEGWVGAK